MDDNDRRRKPFLWIFRWNSWYLSGIRCNNLPRRCLPSRLSCRWFRCMSNWRISSSWRTYQTCVGEKCTGYGRRTGTYANGPDCCKHEVTVHHLFWSTILCTWTNRNRYCTRLWPYCIRYRWSNRCSKWCCIPLLCYTSRTPCTSKSWRRKTGNHGIKNCGTCSWYRKRCPWCKRDRW